MFGSPDCYPNCNDPDSYYCAAGYTTQNYNQSSCFGRHKVYCELSDDQCLRFQSDSLVSYTSCHLCPRGTYFESTKASSCLNCPSGTYNSAEGSSTCLSCPFNSNSDDSNSVDFSKCQCDKGYHGRAYLGEDCLLCSTIWHECPRNSTKPYVIKSGYYLSSETGNVSKCDIEEACLRTGLDESTTCSNGYEGNLCSKCSANFYHSGGKCVKCVSEALKWIVFILVISLFVYVVLRIAQSSGSGSPDLRIVLSWTQIIALYPHISVNWPVGLGDFLRFTALINIDFDFVSPECAMKIEFWKSWKVKVFSPLILIFLSWASFRILKLTKRSGNSIIQTDVHFLGSCSTFIISFLFSYIVVTLAQPFNCFSRSDGSYVLYTDTSVLCFDDSWRQQLPFVVLMSLFYFALLPSVAVYFFWKYRMNLDDPLFLASFRILVEPYRPSVFWWEILVLVRKGFLSLTIFALSSTVTKTTEIAILLCVFMATLSLEIWCKPYVNEAYNQLSYM
jgi:hypothetical protein